MHVPDTPAGSLSEALRGLLAEDHPCLMYESNEELFSVAAPYLGLGLERGERCLYIAHGNPMEAVLAALNENGIDTAASLDRGALTVCVPGEFLSVERPFDPDRFLSLLDRGMEAARTAGFTGLRIAGEMPWTGPDRVVEFEAALNDFLLSRDLPVLCLYDLNRCPADMLLDALRSHPKVIYRGSVCSNEFYRPPSDLPRSGRPDFEVRHLLSGMLERERFLTGVRSRKGLLEAVVENTTDAVFIKDLAGRYLYINRAGASMLNRDAEEVNGRTDRELFATEEAEENEVMAQLALGCTEPFASETTLTFDGEARVFHCLRGACRDVKGNATGTFGIARDITEWRRAKEDRRISDEKYREIFDHAPIGIYRTTVEGRILGANPALARMFGYGSADEMLREPMNTAESFFVNPARRRLIVRDVLESRDFLRYEVEYRRRDGSMFVGNLHIRAVRAAASAVTCLEGFIEDITSRKIAERSLKESNFRFRNLSKHLLAVREDERRKVAREIHDDLGQLLAVMQFELAWLEKTKREEDDGARDRIQSLRDLVNDSMRTMQRIVTELRPRLLDELGLAAAIEWLTDDFSRRTGLDIRMEMDREICREMCECTTAVFRVYQEALTNVLRHAEATEISARLAQSGRMIELEISDNGRGITVEEAFSPTSYGIMGMHERASACGGEVAVTGREGRGTTVRLLMPCCGKGGAHDKNTGC